MEKKMSLLPGTIFVLLQLLLVGLVGYEIYSMYDVGMAGIESSQVIILSLSVIVFVIMLGGYVTIQPNEAVILSFFGKYKGTLDENGFYFTNPFYSASHLSLRISNYATEVLKVNEKDGIPIEIAAIIVHRIKDTYKAEYEVDNVEEYIKNQFEISLRTLAKDHTMSELSSEDRDFIADLTDKVSKAGVEVIDAKITHLNYAPEIASSMLQKQQASSLGEAKEIIVETAVCIANKAAAEIKFNADSDKAKFVSNLIIVLCSEKAVTPTVNVSTN